MSECFFLFADKIDRDHIAEMNDGQRQDDSAGHHSDACQQLRSVTDRVPGADHQGRISQVQEIIAHQ